MSSTYHPICLSHEPPIVLYDIETNMRPDTPKMLTPPEHADCKIGVGRWSGGLIEIWLPIRYGTKVGWHEGEWFDVSWIGRFPGVDKWLFELRSPKSTNDARPVLKPLCPLSLIGLNYETNSHEEFMALYNQGPPLVVDLGPDYYRPWLGDIQ